MSAFPYRTAAVRDLAWACFSPVLIRTALLAPEAQNHGDIALACTPARQRWLQGLDRNPAPLLRYLARAEGRRLGLYFERLWHFFLQEDDRLELVAHNLPVREQGRTLGEFDVIYWCRERRCHVHLELAVKFYLAWGESLPGASVSQARAWLGPNARDRLDLKLDQLTQRQIRLGDQAAARAALSALGIRELKREIAFKGYLFRSPWTPLPTPAGFNAQHRLGHWVTLGQLDAYLEEFTETDCFLPLPRARWLAPATTEDLAESRGSFSRSTLREGLHSSAGEAFPAALVAGIDSAGREQCRFFVTASGWPTSHH